MNEQLHDAQNHGFVGRIGHAERVEQNAFVFGKLRDRAHEFDGLDAEGRRYPQHPLDGEPRLASFKFCDRWLLCLWLAQFGKLVGRPTLGLAQFANAIWRADRHSADYVGFRPLEEAA